MKLCTGGWKLCDGKEKPPGAYKQLGGFFADVAAGTLLAVDDLERPDEGKIQLLKPFQVEGLITFLGCLLSSWVEEVNGDSNDTVRVFLHEPEARLMEPGPHFCLTAEEKRCEGAVHHEGAEHGVVACAHKLRDLIKGKALGLAHLARVRSPTQRSPIGDDEVSRIVKDGLAQAPEVDQEAVLLQLGDDDSGSPAIDRRLEGGDLLAGVGRVRTRHQRGQTGKLSLDVWRRGVSQVDPNLDSQLCFKLASSLEEPKAGIVAMIARWVAGNTGDGDTESHDDSCVRFKVLLFVVPPWQNENLL